MRTRFLPCLLLSTVLVFSTNGCALFGLAADLAIKALPYLMFLADAEATDPGEPAIDRGAEESVQVALDRTRLEPEALPSGWTVLDQTVREAGGRPIVAHALPAGDDLDAEHLAFLERLEAHGGAVRIHAVDARPMIEDPDAGRRWRALAGSGLVLRADGPLAAAIASSNGIARGE